MIKKVLLFAFIISWFVNNAQKAQRIAFIDMEYILENVPEYNEAQAKINAKAIVWQNNIETKQKEIDDLKTALNNQKELLTEDLIVDKEEDIQILELDLKKLKAAYFGVHGDLFFLRQQLVKPIQDLVFNAVQDIAKKRRYDFVLDNSSALIMLYSNNSYNISDLIISSIEKSKKTIAAKEKQNKRKSKTKKVAPEKTISAETQKKLSDREAKRLALQKKIADKKAAQIKKREELKAAIEAKRLKRIQEIEAAKKAKDKN